MELKRTLVDREGAIATVTINRPEARNALNRATLAELNFTFRELAGGRSVQVVILRGAGEAAFSAGADLKEVAELADLPARREYFGAIAELLETIHRMPQPVISRVAGYALAGGMGLAVGCDFAIAADNAIFGLPEITLGLFPMVVMAPILRLCGPRAALELALSGERIDARRAFDLKLVTRVVAADTLDSEVAKLARRLASFSPLVLEMGKRAIYESAGMDYVGALSYLREMVAMVSTSEDCAEGIRAFIEKRKPNFRGR
ncbi:MAG: enoyl-CoA hydratase/isomerase family protein [Candidatus Binataceae bacterium]|nr:enoyl-CoA hydratase/isomerase family protein [Candidatus Binataceae bacterium]